MRGLQSGAKDPGSCAGGGTIARKKFATMSESSTDSQSKSRASDERLPKVGGILAAIAHAAYRRPFLASLAIIIVTTLLGTGATRLRINPDLSELLPRSFDSVKNLDALRSEFGGIGHLTVVCDSENPEALRKFADTLAAALEPLKTVRYVNHRRPVEFFSERALYFLDLPTWRRSKSASRPANSTSAYTQIRST
ncbi:MAG: hypothetical protein GY811_11700 [Myxococcales bacterium]|nr:hypothetical protein [Myxococcales bacterium]